MTKTNTKLRRRYTADEAIALGRRLKAARLRAGLSMRELADGLPSITGAYLSRVEQGQRRPTVEALRLLAPRLGVSVGWLETGRDVVELELPRELLLEVRRTTRRAQLAAAIDEVLVDAPPARAVCA